MFLGWIVKRYTTHDRYCKNNESKAQDRHVLKKASAFFYLVIQLKELLYALQNNNRWRHSCPFLRNRKAQPRRDCRHQTAATQLCRSGTPRRINQIKNDSNVNTIFLISGKCSSESQVILSPLIMVKLCAHRNSKGTPLTVL
jgi:hypothetical protein